MSRIRLIDKETRLSEIIGIRSFWEGINPKTGNRVWQFCYDAETRV